MAFFVLSIVSMIFYVYDISDNLKFIFVTFLHLVQKNGTIAGIALFYEDIIIGFRTNGLVRLRTSQKYKEEVVDRNVRIYSIYRDPHQNVLWVASDGQGTIMYAKKIFYCHQFDAQSTVI